MTKKILIVEDEFIVANDLSIILERAGYTVCGIAGSVEEARELIEKYKPQLVLLDIYLKGNLTGIDLARQLAAENIAFVYLSANSNQKILEEAKATQPYGFMVKPFRERDVLVSLEIAQYLHEQNMIVKHNNEIMLQNSLADIIEEPGGWENKLLKIAKLIQPQIPFDFLSVQATNMNILTDDCINFLRTSYHEYQTLGAEEFINVTGIKKQEYQKIKESEIQYERSSWHNNEDFIANWQHDPLKKLIAKTFKLQSSLTMVPQSKNQGITLSFYSRKPDAYNNKHLALIPRLQKSLLLPNDLASTSNKPIAESRKLPTAESTPPVSVNSHGFDGIIGNSHLLLTALDHLSLVAPLETSVLILGESGTGKERFARSIHSLSARKKKQIVIVNCAALPTHLIESELFGHERGAFTGATERRIGKFEQASGGTIFLDEIGELPLESQAKLLRVLQEKEIERLGGREMIKVDVRIVAATNCNLEKEVASGKFRLDLYYRLNVFPILLPALRDRKDDIPALVANFLRHYCQRASKPLLKISGTALSELEHYSWPGNVRELEHLIERHVLLAKGNTIEKILLPQNPSGVTQSSGESKVKSIDENEMDYILSVLKKCNGRVSGPGGAAELLAVPATTLNSKMKRLGITRKHVS